MGLLEREEETTGEGELIGEIKRQKPKIAKELIKGNVNGCS